MAKLEEARARIGAQNAALQATIDGFQPTIAELTQARVKAELEIAQLRAKVAVFEEAAAMSADNGGDNQALFSMQMRVASLEAQARAKDTVIMKLQQKVLDGGGSLPANALGVGNGSPTNNYNDDASAINDGASRRSRKSAKSMAQAVASAPPPAVPPAPASVAGRGPVKMMQRVAAPPPAPVSAAPAPAAATQGKGKKGQQQQHQQQQRSHSCSSAGGVEEAVLR